MRPRLVMAAHRARPEIGGLEAHVGEVAPRVAALGWDVEVLTTDRSGRLPRAETVGSGASRYRVRRFRAWPRGRDWYLSPGLFLAVLRVRCDVLHVQGVHTLVPPAAMLAARLRRTPYLLTFHSGGSSSALRERARPAQWRVLAPLLRRARGLVGVSQFEARRFEAALGLPVGAIVVVPNGGSLPPPLEPVAVRPGLVVSSGRLERYKGHHRVIEALPHLLRELPEARVEILGAGPEEDGLRALAARLGVAERVTIRFVPPEDRTAMAAALAAAAVVVLLSDYEAHPVAVTEALAVGRPVVVARGSGLGEVEAAGRAIGVDRDAAPEVVAAAILRQVRDPLLVDPGALPTWDACAEALVRLYDRYRRV